MCPNYRIWVNKRYTVFYTDIRERERERVNTAILLYTLTCSEKGIWNLISISEAPWNTKYQLVSTTSIPTFSSTTTTTTTTTGPPPPTLELKALKQVDDKFINWLLTRMVKAGVDLSTPNDLCVWEHPVKAQWIN